MKWSGLGVMLLRKASAGHPIQVNRGYREGRRRGKREEIHRRRYINTISNEGYTQSKGNFVCTPSIHDHNHDHDHQGGGRKGIRDDVSIWMMAIEV